MECDTGIFKYRVYDKDLALVILGVFWLCSVILHILQCCLKKRRLAAYRIHQEIYPMAPRNPELANDRLDALERLENDEEDERWNTQWENERCEFKSFLG